MTAVAGGQALGPFVIERLLARGGMGEVYLARDTRTGHAVVLKLPLVELLGDVAARTRFDREAAALRRLDHPGVQRWIESGWLGQRPYIALQYVDGESLRQVLQRHGRLAPQEALGIGIQIAGALAYCHAQGVVHRDLKPDNVVITPAGRPVLIDFGSALMGGARRITFSGFSGELGTPEYMAPEQVQGKRGDQRTDVYALGTLLYETLAGRPPFAAQSGEGAIHIMRRHLEESPPPLQASGLDHLQQGALARALRRDPEARYPTMEAFRRALEDPASAAAAGEVEPGWPFAPTRTAAWGVSVDEPQSLRDWLRYLFVALATLLVLAAIGIAAAWLRPS